MVTCRAPGGRQAEQWYRRGAQLLVQVARRSAQLDSPEEAAALRDDIGSLVTAGTEEQCRRLERVAALAQQLYGELATSRGQWELTSLSWVEIEDLLHR